MLAAVDDSHSELIDNAYFSQTDVELIISFGIMDIYRRVLSAIK